MSVKDNILTNSKSFHLAFNKIMEALKDDDVSLIAVWGMAGVGKTTLVKEVEERAREIKLFDQVNLEKIQDGIADFLEFKKKIIEMRTAEQLRLRSKNEVRILTILDGIWDVLDLKDIEIPYGEDHKGCKVLLTTRCKQVCTSMEIQNVIPLDILSDEEAFVLFKMNAGDLSSPPLIDAATEIAKGCQGLPAAIVELGTRLSGKDLHVWEITLLRLRSPRFVDGECFGAINRTYRSLLLSYSHLKEMTSKLCFLLCSLFSQDNAIDVEVLTRYAWGLGLYEGIDSIKNVRCMVWASIKDLISSCLLLEHGEMSVKMHNLLRHCALWIASQEKNSFMIGPEIGLKEWQKIEDLPERFVGERLEILSLDGNGCSTISSALMERMKSLKVFTLRNGHLSASALENLTNLRTLHLLRCQLDNISSLGKLEKLEILSFGGSDIAELPNEIGGLNYLRLLDLFDCQKLKKIPLNLMLKSSQLEELYFNCHSFEEWWFEETSIEGSKAKLSEPSRIILPYPLPPNLQTYAIAIKEDGSFKHHHNPTSRILRVTAIPLDTSKDLLLRAECLHLNHVMEKQPTVGQSAKELRVEDCEKPQVEFQNDRLRYISQEDNPTLILSHLTLELIELPQLTCNCKRLTDYVSIQRLKVVKVKNCHKLTSFFSFSLAKRMVSLEKLVIDGCHSLKQIIIDTDPIFLPRLITLEITDCEILEYVFRITTASFAPQLMVLNISRCPQLSRVMEVGNEHIELPQLQRLTLKSLKGLTTFCSGEFYIGLPSLEELEVEACPQLSICEIIRRSKVKDLCLFNVGSKLCEDIIQLQGGYFLSCLQKLVLKELLDLQAIWKDPSQVVTLQNLSHLKVFRCNKLRYIFSVLLARNLPQLSHVEVQECEELEQVVSQDLISSSSMAHHKPVYFPNLEEICIMECNKLKSLFPVSVYLLPKLKKLEVKGASNLREIFPQDGEANMTNNEKLKEVLLPELEVLFLENLPNLIRFTTVNYYLVFPALISLTVYACPRKIVKFSFHDDSKGSYVRAEIEKSLLPEGGNVDSSITSQNIKSDKDNNILWAHPWKKPGSSDITKSLLRKKTHANKNGEYKDEAILDMANKMNDCSRNWSAGTVTTENGVDALPLALGNKESAGHARGVETYITPKVYVSAPRGNLTMEEAQKLVEEHKKLYEEQIAEQCQMFELERNEWRECLAMLEAKILGLPIPSLPTPSFENGSSSNKKLIEVHGDEDDDYMIVNVKSSKKPVHNVLATESNAMDALVKYANQLLPTGGTMLVSIEDELFPYSIKAYVVQEQINHIASFGQIEVTCILIYMSLLYKCLKEQKRTQMYGFIDPSKISHDTGNIATRQNGVAYTLESALPEQLFFAPYNSGNHWQLVVIHPYNDTVYFFDSLRGNPKQEIKEIIDSGLNLFNAKKEREDRKITWKTIKSPCQSGGHECGYYVMRYMKEIIENGIPSISDKFLGKEEYTMDEINEVRKEWFDYVVMKFKGE